MQWVGQPRSPQLPPAAGQEEKGPIMLQAPTQGTAPPTLAINSGGLSPARGKGAGQGVVVRGEGEPWSSKCQAGRQAGR